ncbi:MAG: hypothetical protein IPM14_12250 [bacterium]|nr:hypothetical protein [bacterium]
MKKIFVFVIIIVFQQLLFSQSEKTDSTAIQKPDTLAVRGVDWLAYPYIFYSPETSLAFGGGGIVYFKLYDDPKAKSSSITPSFYYTVNGQYDVTIIPELFYLKINLKSGQSSITLHTLIAITELETKLRRLKMINTCRIIFRLK